MSFKYENLWGGNFPFLIKYLIILLFLEVARMETRGQRSEVRGRTSEVRDTNPLRPLRPLR